MDNSTLRTVLADMRADNMFLAAAVALLALWFITVYALNGYVQMGRLSSCCLAALLVTALAVVYNVQSQPVWLRRLSSNRVTPVV